MISEGSSLAPFRNRQFRLYWFAGLASNIGWMIQIVAAAWMMTSVGGTPELVALVQTAMSLPLMLFALPSGAIADAVGRRRTIIWAQSILLPISLILAAFASGGLLTPWALLLFVFLVSTCKAMNGPAWLTMVSEILPREGLPSGIAMNSVGFNIARSLGPAVGGAIVAGFGAFAAFLLSAVSNLGMLLVAVHWRKLGSAGPLPPEPVGTAMMAGLRYVALSPTLLIVMMRAAVFNFAAVSIMALMPLIAQDLLQGGPRTYGFLLGAFGLGAVVGALNAGRMRARLSPEWLVRTGFVALGAMTFVMSASRLPFVTMTAAAIGGACWLMAMSTLSTTVQMSSPRWVLSRCQSIYQGSFFGANALGSLVWGLAAGQIGTAGALAISALVLLAGAAVGAVYPLQELDAPGTDSAAARGRPPQGMDMARTSGPIVTSVAYRIADSDVPAFLAAMRERQRHRIRDGARRWTLSRDLQQPDRWIERYMTPTWIEHERLLTRRTVAGAQVANLLLALHRGPDRPEIHHELVRDPATASAAPPAAMDLTRPDAGSGAGCVNPPEPHP